MRPFRAWLARIGDMFIRTRRDREFANELESHLQLHIDDSVRAGMPPAEARRQALITLGGIDQTKERYRDRQGSPLLDGFIQDVRYGLRTLRRNPGFTAVAAGTLAVGIGATTTVFGLFNAVIIRSLPYGDAGRLVYIDVSHPRFAAFQAPWAPSVADFFDLQRTARSFSSMATFAQVDMTLTAGENPQRISAAKVTGDFFQTLNATAELGRDIVPTDDRPESERIAVISDQLWRSMFQRRADILSQSLTLDRQTYRVVGVMLPEFQYPRATDLGFDVKGATDVWVPLAATEAQRTQRDFSNNDAVVARLRPGVSVAQGRAELEALFPPLDLLHAQQWRGWRVGMRSFADNSFRGLKRPMWLLLGAISLVLLIACSNAAHLVLARSVGRAHEVGVRAALGASRARIIRQLVTEAVLLAGAGGALGVAVAAGGVRILPLLDPGNIPRLDQASIDLRVLLFTVGVSLITGVAVGLFPALTLSRATAHDLLKAGGATRATRASARPREVLIVAEVAIAFLLLTGASLLVRSYLAAINVDRGFSSSTLTFRITLDDRYRLEQRRGFFQGVLNEIRETAGVQSAGAVSTLPLSHSEAVSIVTTEGHLDQKDQVVNTRAATADYFDAMSIRLIAGRLLNDDDVDGRPAVAVVNQAFANKYFPNEDALGKRLCRCFVISGAVDMATWSTIVGVVGDVRHSNLEDAPPPEIYTSFLQGEPFDSLFFAIRTSLPERALLPGIRRIVRAHDPSLAIGDVRMMDERVSEASASRRFETSLLIVFAGTALALAGIGLFGLLAYTARQRAQEFAIRMALGARSADILRLVLLRAMTLTAGGLVLGFVVAMGTTRLLTSLLYGVTPRDPIAFVVVPTMLTGVALFASWLPARRATRVDPLTALRRE